MLPPAGLELNASKFESKPNAHAPWSSDQVALHNKFYRKGALLLFVSKARCIGPRGWEEVSAFEPV